MIISQVGINLIKSFEGCRLTSYQDSVGVWTIGYGHTSGVHQGQTITQQQADQLLADELQSFSKWVSDCCGVPITQYQFDAMVSLCYNIGKHAFATSTLLQLLNKKDYQGASNQFSLWCRGGGKVLQGLVNRRKAEQALFNRSAEYQDYSGTSTQTYTVKTGDTLTKIAHIFGTSIDYLMKINPTITNPNKINEGQKINVPRN
jgi:lysozyme